MASSKTSSGFSDNSPTETQSASSSGTHTDNEMDDDTAHDPNPSFNSAPYSQGERVLAYHNVRFYEAKVLQIENKHNEWRFFLHYVGWNKSWDEWVGVDRLMKRTEENLQRKRDLSEKQGTDKNAKAACPSYIKPKNSNVARGMKRKNDSVNKEKAGLHSNELLNIQIPPTLKKQLVDDCEFITHLGKLVKLPRSPNVNDILKKYVEYRLKKDGLIADSVEEIMKGLRCYFDKALPMLLLYKNERQQYQEACLDDIRPSTVYGAEHLLRLFVKLPEMLSHIDTEAETVMELQAQLVDFLRFLRKHQSTFFLSTYHETSTNNQND